MIEPLHTEQPAAEHPREVTLNDEKSTVSSPATPPDRGLYLEENRSFVYKAQAPRLGCIHSYSVKKKKPSSTMMKTTRQNKRVTRTSSDEEGVQVDTKSVAKAEDVNDAAPTTSGALQLEA